jgi:hypothetical protein
MTLKTVTGKSVILVLLLAGSLIVQQVQARCNLEENCPMDGQASHRVGTEYAGTTEIGVFGHELLNGGEHTFRVRCNN